MKRFFLTLTIAAAMFTGCATTQVVQTTDYMESSARILDGEQKMLVNPIIADLKVSATKVYHTETEAFIAYPITQSLIDNNMTTFKAIAISRAAKAHNADVLVGTTIDVVTKNNRIAITVSGYPAYYTKFRNVSKSDIDLIREANAIKTITGEDIIAAPKSKANLNK